MELSVRYFYFEEKEGHVTVFRAAGEVPAAPSGAAGEFYEKIRTSTEKAAARLAARERARYLALDAKERYAFRPPVMSLSATFTKESIGGKTVFCVKRTVRLSRRGRECARLFDTERWDENGDYIPQKREKCKQKRTFRALFGK